MTAEELMRMTVKDLRALAERQGMSGVGKLRKDQLIGTLLPLIATATKPAPSPLTAAQPAGSSANTNHQPPAPRSGPDPGLPIPESYAGDRLVLLVQDPHHIFAYWEVSGVTYARCAIQAGPGATTVLLLHTASGAEQREIDLRGGNYYLAVAPGATYRAEIALRGRDGRLYSLAVSNFVQTPAAGPSTRTDATWMEVDETFQELLSLAGLPGQTEAAGSVARLTARTMETRILVHEETIGLSSGELARGGRAHLAEGLSSSSLSSSTLNKR